MPSYRAGVVRSEELNNPTDEDDCAEVLSESDLAFNAAAEVGSEELRCGERDALAQKTERDEELDTSLDDFRSVVIAKRTLHQNSSNRGFVIRFLAELERELRVGKLSNGCQNNIPSFFPKRM